LAGNSPNSAGSIGYRHPGIVDCLRERRQSDGCSGCYATKGNLHSSGLGRWRLISQLLTESVSLAILGGTFGLLLAHWLLKLFTAMMPRFTLPRLALSRTASPAAASGSNFVPRRQRRDLTIPVSRSQTGFAFVRKDFGHARGFKGFMLL
jgi:hypothetical protein